MPSSDITSGTCVYKRDENPVADFNDQAVKLTGAELRRLGESLAYDVEAIRADRFDARLNGEAETESVLTADLNLITTIASKLRAAAADAVRPKLLQLLQENDRVCSVVDQRLTLLVGTDLSFVNWTVVPNIDEVGAYGMASLDLDLNITKIVVFGTVNDPN